MSPRQAARVQGVPETSLVARFRFAARAFLGTALTATLGAAFLGIPELLLAAHPLAFFGGGLSILGYFALRRRAPNWSDVTTIVASGEGLRIGDASLVPRAEMAEAIVTPRSSQFLPWWRRMRGETAPTDRYEVEIRLRGRFRDPIRFSTRTLDEARDVVEALGLGAGRRAVTRKVVSPFAQPKATFPMVFGGMLLSFLGAALARSVHPAFGTLVAAAPLGIVGVYVLGLIKTKVTIGADAVSVRWLGKPTTIPLAEIERVEVVPAGFFTTAKVRLVRRSGPAFEIAIGLRGQNPFEPYHLAEECARIAERIREAIAVGHAAEPIEFQAWAAHRQRLPIGEWIAMLRGAIDAYRDEGTMPFSKAELWSVVENAQARPAERAAAAVAVSAKLDEPARARLRDVAASTAVPRLRVVLEAAAEGDDPKLSAALEELRAEEPAEPETTESAPAPKVRVEPAEDDADQSAAERRREAASE